MYSFSKRGGYNERKGGEISLPLFVWEDCVKNLVVIYSRIRLLSILNAKHPNDNKRIVCNGAKRLLQSIIIALLVCIFSRSSKTARVLQCPSCYSPSPFESRRVDRSCIRRQLSGMTSWHGVSCLHRYVMPRPPIEARAWYHVIATVLASDSGRSCNWLGIPLFFFFFGQYYRYSIAKDWFLIAYNCFRSIYIWEDITDIL